MFVETSNGTAGSICFDWAYTTSLLCSDSAFFTVLSRLHSGEKHFENREIIDLDERRECFLYLWKKRIKGKTG